LLVATPQKLDIDVESLKRKLSAPAVAADMRPWNLDDPVGVLENFVCGEETLRQWTGDGTINTDNLPHTQYETRYSNRSQKLGGNAIAPLVESIWPYLHNTGDESESRSLEQELALRSKANKLMFMGKYAEAFSLLPEDGKVTAYRENRKLNIEYILQVADLYRDCPGMLHRTGLELFNMGRQDEAIAHYKQAVAINPDFAEAYNNLGVAMVKQGRQNEAIALYQQAIAIEPKFAEAHSNVGVALAKQGRQDEAIAHYKQAIAIRPDFAETLNNLGLALATQGKLDEAFAHVENAIRVDPYYVEARCLLGNLLGDQGRFDEAIAQFHEALRIDPDHENTLRSLVLAKQLKAQSLASEPKQPESQ
jgi:superkiller protein 3